MASASTTTTSCCGCCSPQLHLLRRPAPSRPLPRLRLRLPLPFRLRAQASPEPSPEPQPQTSFAGWSDEEEAAAAGPFGGLLGPGLAGLFFLAGITYAAISVTTKHNGSRPQMEPLPTHTQTASYSTDNNDNTPANQDDASQDLSPTNTQDATTKEEKAATTAPPTETNETPADSGDLDLTNDKHTAGDGASRPGYLVNPDDGTGTAHPASTSTEYNTADYDDKPIGPSEGTPILQHKSLDYEPSLQENPHMDDDEDDTLTSDIMVLDSGDVVVIKDADASHPRENDAEQQDPQPSNKDELSGFPDYVVNGSAADNALKETLAADQDQGQSESDNQSELFKSTAPAKSFTSAGIPAPSLLSAALQVPAGQIVVPAAVDPTQGNALAALQVLKVIEPGAQSGDLCTRREYARWLVVASNSLSRNTYSKVCPAMYIENVSELAFDDVTTEDPDFQFIQDGKQKQS